MEESNEYRYAGFWIRFLAYLIDAVILSIVGAIILAGLGGYSGDPVAAAAAARTDSLILFVGQWLYFALMESSSLQGTLGKKACGLSVADLEGNRISFGRATGRFFAKFISAIILLIGFMMAGWTHRKQALHDKIAGTLVLKRISHLSMPTVHEVGHAGGVRVQTTTRVGGVDPDMGV